MNKIYVKDLLKSAPPALGLVLAAGSGDTRKRPVYPDFQKVGLALAGHFEDIDPHKLQVLGRTEVSYLKKLTPARRKKAIEGLMGRRASAYIITSGGSPPEEMLKLADELNLPVLTCPLDTVRCIRGILKAIDERASGDIHVHGVLVDIMGVGVLILGASGIGKSECAIELVVRGHRLVADDIVVVKKLSDGRLVGSGAEMIRYLVEVRGIGIVNVKDLFGI
ncbi:MAG TPA: DRTGG domain-containing protein, partial [Nitrospirota bacterium]